MQVELRKVRNVALATMFTALLASPSFGDEAAQIQELYEAAKGQSLVLAVHSIDGLEQYAQYFASQFPEVNVELTVINPSALAPRVLTEQQGGIYAWDAYIGGTGNMENNVIPAGGLGKMEGYIVLPSILDKDQWLPNDRDQTYVFPFTGWAERTIYANTTRLAEIGMSFDELTTFESLTDPRLVGEIAMRDPGRENNGSYTLGAAIQELGDIDAGLAILRTLLTEMDAMIVDNAQQVTNTVMTGEKAIVIGGGPDIISRCQIVGGCTDIKRLPIAPYMNYRGAVTFTNAPNPEATKLFLNWLGSEDGQRNYVRIWSEHNTTGAVSLRRDVAPVHPDDLPREEDIFTIYQATSEKGSHIASLVVGLRKETQAGN